MKKILLLIVVLAALVGVGVVVQNQQNASLNSSARRGAAARELLLPDLDPTAVQKIRLKDDKSEVNVAIADDRKSATVAERDGYPASLDRISTVLNDLRTQKIAAKQEVRKGAWAEIKVQAPGAGAEGVGTLVELIAPGAKVLRSMVLGEVITAAGSNAPAMGGTTQRTVRIPEDGDTIWTVSNPFFDLEAKPEAWLDKAFIDVQKIKEVAVTAPKAEDSWTVRRADEAATEFVLADAKVGEGLDADKLAVSGLLSAPTFNDVISKDKAGDALKDATKAKLTTFDGFVYDVQVVKHSKDGKDKYFMTVSVKADIPKERAPVKDEKPEDKKKKDEEFAAQKKTLEEKLAKEQKFAGWVYEVTEYAINNLLKKRPEIVTVTAKAGPAPSGSAPGGLPLTPEAVPGLPKFTPPATNPSVNQAPPSITTPPVAAPSAPKIEVKPAPSPDANPATGDKPAAPAPAPAASAPAAPAK